MSLLTDFQARYSNALRRNWSNPQNSAATSINTTLEGLAAADAGADFAAVCGVAYDGTVATHVTAATSLVVYKLMMFTGQATLEQYDAQLERLRKWYAPVLGRNRLVLDSTSELIPTEPDAGNVPMSDISQFGPFIGNAPGEATDTNNGGGGLPWND